MNRILASCAFVVAVAMVALAGCDQTQGLSGLVPAEGTVTFQGAPVEGATVTFAPQGNAMRAAAGMTDAQGKFVLKTIGEQDGVMPGDYMVTVTKFSSESQSLSQEEMEKYIAEHGAPPTVEQTNALPEKYERTGTSGLTATVAEGQSNQFEFALTE